MDKKIATRPVVIGIGGGTASGKTVLAEALCGKWQGTSAIVPLDNYYKGVRPELGEKLEGYNFDHPDALELDLLAAHLGHLVRGRPVQIPEYDFTTHSRKKSCVSIKSVDLIVIEGLFVFNLEEISRHFDVSVFLDVDPDVRLYRRIMRDVESRGRTLVSVCEHYFGTVKKMHDEFVEPYRSKADVVFNNVEIACCVEVVLDRIDKIVR